MKKIMNFVHGLTMGGAETLVKDYLLNLNKKEYELVLLVLEKHNSQYEKILEDNNIKIIYVQDNLINKKNIFSKIYNHYMCYIIVKKIIHKEKPDIIHYHLPIDSYVKFACPAKGTKLFSTIHSEPSNLYNNSKKAKREFNAAKSLVKKYNLRFLVLHDDMRKQINKMFNVNNSIVVNNGIDFDKFNNYIEKDKMRKRLNIPKDALVVGHVGRFSAVKNHTFLVDIFNEIYNKNKNSFLLLIGTGEEKKYIEQKLNNLNLNNHYLILEDRTDIPDLMNAMDVFLFPSLYEGLGIVLIEAQKMKLPCFKSDNVPNYAVISNLVTSISLNKNAKEWADKILNYKYPKNVVLKDEEWDMKKVVKKIEKIYEEKM